VCRFSDPNRERTTVRRFFTGLEQSFSDRVCVCTDPLRR
jgi:hypothetical protein